MDNVIFPDEDDDWSARGRRAVASDPEDDLDAHAYLEGDEDDEWDEEPAAARRGVGGSRAPFAAASGERVDAAGEARPRRMRAAVAGPRAAADQMLDELLPEQLDWQRLVRQYPIPSLAVAALGGYLLGRYKGAAVLAALSAFAADAVADNVNEILGDELI